ncbi:Mov34-domain-containing protein [Wallemia mellicola]|uniref:Eukaryotic translation initiation factor 3 subunit F n=1 Tax=Wallemia mellicola TaxID=1708541 RepID=A0A4T0R9Z8_9BASI|nr:hypothetical protein E3Q23_00350 [Wallemia mellicola]TIB81144.1 Mov34-domain-containing protein [Wallemia mellicola]TIB90538.1 Mov34-domain-containing protein [Wallemia mellicola]TIB94535.1 Mov34-domain-containing protein [Wallemia mellicola]TIC06348.1 Mov34-domain-containing protein [Wallemia mellicola]
MLDHFKVGKGAGFPNHPHRGQATVTMMLKGTFKHGDNQGHSGYIHEGGVQFMKAASGLIHSEMPVQDKPTDPVPEGLQLWVDLPEGEKSAKPEYQEFSDEQLPRAYPQGNDGDVEIKVISGETNGVKSPVTVCAGCWYFDISLKKKGAQVFQDIPSNWNTFSYIISGNAKMGDKQGLKAHSTITFTKQDEQNGLQIEAEEDNTRLVLIAGEPLNQKVIQYGPFVLSSEEDIYKAFEDYQLVCSLLLPSIQQICQVHRECIRWTNTNIFIRNRQRGIHVHPAALFSILDHFMRRPMQQERVIGALLGSRSSESDVEVKSAFAVPHSENDEQATVDSEHLQSMLDLHLKVNPREVLVGWYATGSSLNAYSALIQNFFTQQNTQPYNAVHLTVDTQNFNFKDAVKGYLGSSLGPLPKMDNCVFQSLPVDLLVREQEKASLDALAAPPKQTLDDIPALRAALEKLSAQIDEVLAYVEKVVSGEVEGDAVVGKALLSAVQSLSTRFEEGDLNKILDAHIQDTKAVSYLADLIRTQADIASRLSLLG